MNNRRIQQLAYMLSYIVDIEPEEAKLIITETETGKAIQDNNMTVMYEQQTENLVEIAMEFKKEGVYSSWQSLLTTENIVRAAKALRNFEKNTQKVKSNHQYLREKDLELKAIMKKRLSERRKTVLAIKKQNQINVRRAEYVNKFKG